MAEHMCITIVPLFEKLSDADKEAINDLVRHREYRKGELVFQPGDDELAIVARGSMKVYQLSPSGKEQLLRVVRPGGYEGESQLFGIRNETLFAEALEDTVICSLSKKAFNQVLMSNPEIGIRLFELSSQKMVQMERQVQLLSLERVEERLAAYLLDLSEKEADVKIELPMKMKDVSLYLGTTPETLSRKFRYLEDQGLIERKGRTVTILDEDGLLDI
ncbi:MAG: Crp/Fnr family transcriptional regulator [Atopobiaceae bacterium]